MSEKFIHEFLKAVPESEIILYDIFNKYKNTNLAKTYYKLTKNDKNNSYLFNYCIKYHTLLNKDHYNRNVNIDEINNYTVLNNINIKEYSYTENNSSEIKKLTYSCLTQILDTKLIKVNGKNIKLSECIIVDFLSSVISNYNDFHTDLQYEYLNSPSFNVWYLIKNNKKYGNMFLLETNEYKTSYTPCYVNDEKNKNNNVTVYNNSLTRVISNYGEPMGELDIKKMKITYLNMSNGECLIMSKHQLHRTDLRRDNQNGKFLGCNFRIVIKNKDGSISFNGDKRFIKSHHKYDSVNKKLFGVEIFDFL